MLGDKFLTYLLLRFLLFCPFLMAFAHAFLWSGVAVCHRSFLPSVFSGSLTLLLFAGRATGVVSGVSSRTLIASTRALKWSSSASSSLRSSGFIHCADD